MYWQTSWLSVSQHIGRYIDWVSVKSLSRIGQYYRPKCQTTVDRGWVLAVMSTKCRWYIGELSVIDKQRNDLRLTDRKTVVADSARLSQELSDTLPQLTKKATDISRYICRHQQKNMWFHIPTQSQTGCHSGKLYRACTSLKVISASLRKKLMSRIDCSSSVIWILPKNHLPIGQVMNRIHQPQAIGHHFLCLLQLACFFQP